jgi:hypothetical protein
MIELNVYGTFAPGPWGNGVADILKAVQRREWEPGTEDLRIFASSGGGAARVEGVVNCNNLLCALYRHKPNRLNIFTHANDKYLYLCGWAVPGDVKFDTSKEANCIDSQFLVNAEDNNMVFSDKYSQGVTMKDVRDALPKPFEIGVFACHTALNYDLLRGVANFFNCHVKAFRGEIRYYLSGVTGKPNVLLRKYGIEDSTPVDSYRDLEKFFQAPMVPDSERKSVPKAVPKK